MKRYFPLPACRRRRRLSGPSYEFARRGLIAYWLRHFLF